MKEDTLKKLMKIYLTLRKFWDPIIVPKDLSPYRVSAEEFSRAINAMEYKQDKINGLIDRTDDPNTFFDETKESDRDCDDFQRQYSIWGVVNNCKATEWVVCSNTSVLNAINTMHVIGTLEQGGKYWLTNYEMYGPFNSEEEALDYMKWFPSYMEERVIVKYRDIEF